jgi:hypothetical protein
VSPSLLVISISDVEEALFTVRLSAVIVSVAISVWKVNASVVVADEPGASVNEEGSVPEVSIVAFPGRIGDPLAVTPTE